MKCPECIKEGKRSRVTRCEGHINAVYVPIEWDEDGNLIERPDMSSTRYVCSNGHEWWA
jgi:hypothetical protein